MISLQIIFVLGRDLLERYFPKTKNVFHITIRLKRGIFGFCIFIRVFRCYRKHLQILLGNRYKKMFHIIIIKILFVYINKKNPRNS